MNIPLWTFFPTVSMTGGPIPRAWLGARPIIVLVPTALVTVGIVFVIIVGGGVYCDTALAAVRPSDDTATI
jgi:hypothetical protein